MIKTTESGYAVLNLPYSFMGGQGTINPFLVWDKDNVVLIDTGFPGQALQINELLKTNGIGIEQLTHIIITHHDLDHIGSLSELKYLAGNTLKIMAHPLEKSYIEMEKLPLKMTPERIRQIENNPNNLMKGSLKDSLFRLKTRVDILVDDNTELDICGGLNVIFTPGHTTGHISIYVKKYKMLVAGDALNLSNGELVGPDLNFTYDMQQATKSLKQLLNYDIESVLCYHGGLFNGDVKESIKKIINHS